MTTKTSSAVPSTSSEWARYEPRLFADLGTTERQWQLKFYGIHHDMTGDKVALIDPAVLQSGRTRVCDVLAEAESVGAHHNVG